MKRIKHDTDEPINDKSANDYYNRHYKIAAVAANDKTINIAAGCADDLASSSNIVTRILPDVVERIRLRGR